MCTGFQTIKKEYLEYIANFIYSLLIGAPKVLYSPWCSIKNYYIVKLNLAIFIVAPCSTLLDVFKETDLVLICVRTIASDQFAGIGSRT